MKINHPWEWLFDGVGGAALLALIGFVYHKFRSRQDVNAPQSIASEAVDVSAVDGSVAVSNRSSVHSSPVVLGSHNVVNIHHVEAEADKPDENEEVSVWGVLSILLVLLAVVGGAVYLLVRFSGTPETPARTQQTSADSSKTTADSSKPTYAVAFQYGNGIKSGVGTGAEYTECTAEGITCLGGNAIVGKVISLPREASANWSRIAVLISFSDGGGLGRIVVSTPSDDVGLNYADHRDGTFHKQIEFQNEYPEAISETQKPYWYPLDIVYREAGVKFPLTVTVAEDDHPAHSVTANFQIQRPPLVLSKKPASGTETGEPKMPASDTETKEQKPITIAERVTAIIAERLYINRERVKPEEDFEIDLGGSPTQVTLIINDLEEEYGISIPKSDALRIRTAGEAIEYVERTQRKPN